MDHHHASHFDGVVSELALHYSRLRKTDRLTAPHILDAIPSSKEEMDRDWIGALSRCLSDTLEGFPKFFCHEDVCFERLAQAWLDDVKEYKAYHFWRERWPIDGIWSVDQKIQADYANACSEIHDLILSRKIKRDCEEFAPIKKFILNGSPSLRGNAELIRRKAARRSEIGKCNDDLENWLSAEHYVDQFYRHIIPAVEDRNSRAAHTVLMSLQNSYGTNRQSLFVSGLEAYIAIRFLDVSLIEDFEAQFGSVF